jgi:hypothetical protein
LILRTNTGGAEWIRESPQVAGNVPGKMVLSQNFPNPFNPTTLITYQLSAASHVKLMLYDILGREVRVLVNEKKNPGNYTVEVCGCGLASGVYFYQLTAGSLAQTKRMVLLR